MKLNVCGVKYLIVYLILIGSLIINMCVLESVVFTYLLTYLSSLCPGGCMRPAVFTLSTKIDAFDYETAVFSTLNFK